MLIEPTIFYCESDEVSSRRGGGESDFDFDCCIIAFSLFLFYLDHLLISRRFRLGNSSAHQAPIFLVIRIFFVSLHGKIVYGMLDSKDPWVGDVVGGLAKILIIPAAVDLH